MISNVSRSRQENLTAKKEKKASPVIYHSSDPNKTPLKVTLGEVYTE